MKLIQQTKIEKTAQGHHFLIKIIREADTLRTIKYEYLHVNPMDTQSENLKVYRQAQSLGPNGIISILETE